MKEITVPKAFIIAETTAANGWAPALREIGAEDWYPKDYQNDAEALIEFAGRLCYKSFDVGLNKNLTKTREGNREYIANILSSKHGSVLEHASTSIAMIGVSRILTHELVRHRAGAAYSQESMRFVRMDDVPVWLADPHAQDLFNELAGYMDNSDDCQSAADLKQVFEDAMGISVRNMERLMTAVSPFLDKEGIPFALKKKITSLLRRAAPSGHATNIIATCNHRAWRHLIEMRTSAGAEEEIRIIFGSIAEQFKERYKNFYQDMQTNKILGSDIPEYKFLHSKV